VWPAETGFGGKVETGTTLAHTSGMVDHVHSLEPS
jgi:hypothetical protein